MASDLRFNSLRVLLAPRTLLLLSARERVQRHIRQGNGESPAFGDSAGSAGRDLFFDLLSNHVVRALRRFSVAGTLKHCNRPYRNVIYSSLYQALAYTAPDVPSRRGPIDRYIESVLAQFRKGLTSLAEKKTLDVTTISSVRTWHISYRVLRFLSRWLYGRPARNRAALFVLIKYMSNLCVLGGLAILFWALVIRYFSLPGVIGMVPALLASSARVIPGIPEPSLLKFPDWIKASTSITAWMIFVLYAGPVASLFGFGN